MGLNYVYLVLLGVNPCPRTWTAYTGHYYSKMGELGLRSLEQELLREEMGLVREGCLDSERRDFLAA